MKLLKDNKKRGTLSKVMAMALCLGGLTSCIGDDIGPCTQGGDGTPKDYYYINLSVTMPAQATSRGETDDKGSSTNGDLQGTLSENSLVSAVIYFCEEDYTELASFASDYVEPMSSDGSTTIRIKVDDISKLTVLAGDNGEKRKVRILIVGNTLNSDGSDRYTPTIKSDVGKSTFSVSGIDDALIGDYGQSGHIMPLVSADYLEREIDSTVDGMKTAEDIIKALFEKKTPNNAWWEVNKTEPIELERAVARIEYRGQIQPKEETAGGEEEFEETHIYQIAEGEDNEMNVYLELATLAPFNVRKESYLFRHTSPGDDSGWALNEVNIFGLENGKTDKAGKPTGFTGYNWIASPWWTGGDATKYNAVATDVANNRYTIGNTAITSRTPGTISIEELCARKRSEELQTTNGIHGGYHPWCYVSENTLYSTALMKDENVADNATGVALRFKVLDNDRKAISNKVNKTEFDLPDEIQWTEEGNLEITNLKNGNWVEVSADEDGFYYLTYIACIRHNVRTEVGPMYYGVVRNNTYQISIGKILDLPLPREAKNLYLELTVNVLSWTKRDVQIDF